MVRMSRRRLALAGAGALLAAPAAAQQRQAPRSYVLTTATTGGTFYPVGVAIATLIRVRLQASQGLNLSAISSAGSTENVKLLRENQAQFAILTALVGQFAAAGTGPFQQDGPQRNLRGIMPLWYNISQVIVDRRLVTTGRIGDLANLQGRRYSMGARGSGLETMNLWMLPNLGIDHTRFDLVYQGYGPTAEGIQNGTIQGSNFDAGIPTGSVTQLMANAGDRVQFLEFNEDDIRRANGGTQLLSAFVIPANTYPNQPRPVNTVRLPNYLACNAAVPEDDVYQITRAIFENLPFLNNIHAATREISLQDSLGGYPFPLHPGAIRFYRERGMNVPAALIPS